MRTDRIEKKVLLRATRERTWQAISDAGQFGSWFGVAFDGPFAQGTTLTGRIVPTTVDANVAALQAPHAGKRFELRVECIEPMNRITFRWHPFAIDPSIDYSQEPMTLIEFTLEDTPDGVLLTIIESGFDHIPQYRRAKAFDANEGGWEKQTMLVRKFLERSPDGIAAAIKADPARRRLRKCFRLRNSHHWRPVAHKSKRARPADLDGQERWCCRSSCTSARMRRR